MEVKTFRVEGTISKPGYAMPFSKNIRALRMEDAVEKIYAELGSQHRAKRVHVKITSVNEVPLEETKDATTRKLGGK